MPAPEHRLAMCQVAISGDPFFNVDDIETRRPGPSFTLATVRELKQRGFPEVSWLIGADMAMFLPRWHEPASLMAEVNFILMARPGWVLDWLQIPSEFRHLQKNVVPTPQLDISSTLLRERLGRGQSIRYLTAASVVDYIRQHGLYQT